MLREHSKISLDFLGQQIGLKDCSPSFIRNFVGSNHLEKILDAICPTERDDLKKRKYITVDVFEKQYTKGERTCKDIDWHVDGKSNIYFMYQLGENRTEFQEFGEIAPGILYEYDSESVHKGRDVQIPGRRMMIRLCFSDYISHRNKRFY